MLMVWIQELMLALARPITKGFSPQNKALLANNSVPIKDRTWVSRNLQAMTGFKE